MELEDQSKAFYAQVLQNPACADIKDMMEQFNADAGKNTKLLQLTRRENVSEMILEAIDNFGRAPFQVKCDGGNSRNRSETLAIAKKLEKTCESYYRQAAIKMGGLPEVARALKFAGKRRTDHCLALNEV